MTASQSSDIVVSAPAVTPFLYKGNTPSAVSRMFMMTQMRAPSMYSAATLTRFLIMINWVN